MFLVYRNDGERQYGGTHRLEPYPRNAWEFQVTVSGSCSLLLRTKQGTIEKRLQGPVLNIAGPECVYGWSGTPEDRCEVIVMQFDETEPNLAALIGIDGQRSIPIKHSDIALFRTLYDRCAEARKSPGFAPLAIQRMPGIFPPIIYHIVGLEVALLSLKLVPPAELGPVPAFGEKKVAQALAWYAANLSRAPSIQDVAESVHVSPTHLRRLFHRIKGVSPQAAFSQAQFERAKWLMRDLSLSLERIAESAGFGSASAFSRSFKQAHGVSPRSYRARIEAEAKAK